VAFSSESGEIETAKEAAKYLAIAICEAELEKLTLAENLSRKANGVINEREEKQPEQAYRQAVIKPCSLGNQ